jgi:uncharacterized protein YdaU (DUF1376 family)
MPDAPSDPVRDALAWFIMEDDTKLRAAKGWSTCRWRLGHRLAKQFFSSEEEIHKARERHERRMHTQAWPQKMDDLPDSATAHEAIETAARIKHWASIP